jgi:hypothetical protein
VPLAEEQIFFPVQDWLGHARQLMSNPLLSLLQANGDSSAGGLDLLSAGGAITPSNGQAIPKDLREFGQYLYGTLFQKTLRDSWVMAQGIAQHRGEVLRLRLGLKGLDLPRLPWEVMHSVESTASGAGQPGMISRPLAAGIDIIFSRYQADMGLRAGTNLPNLLQPGQPLRLLMAIAAPSDQVRLNLRKEAQHLQQELAARKGALMNGTSNYPEIELTLLEQPGREQLTQALEQGHFQMFHYAGHSNLSEAGGSLYLVNDRTGLTETLSGEDLAGLLANNGIQMAVFNSCQGAHTVTDSQPQKGRNLAEALVSRGIPAVLAMAENIPDEVALSLSRLFYRNLKQGYPIDLSLSRARQGLISSYGSAQLYWALPVLYLSQTFDGYLTAGDRTIENPADRLLLSQHTAKPSVNLSAQDLNSSLLSNLTDADTDPELEMISNAVLAEDDLSDWVEDFTDSNRLGSEDDLIYEEDTSELVQLIQQLSRSQPEVKPIISADQPENLLPDTEDIIHTLYEELPEDPHYQTSSDISALTPSDRNSIIRRADENAGSDLAISSGNGEVDSYSQKIRYPRTTITVDETHYDESVLLNESDETDDWNQLNQQNKLGKKRQKFGSIPVIASLTGVGIAAIALSFLLIPNLQFWQNGSGQLSPNPNVSLSSTTSDLDASQDFSKVETAELTTFAITKFEQNELDKGVLAVTELFNRGALQEAKTALAAVPQPQIDQAPISFLNGRLNWEQVNRQNLDYSAETAMRYWASAVKANPQSIEYLTALGFAYYAIGNSDAALKTWCDAVEQSAGDASTPAEAAIANEINTDGSSTIRCPLLNPLPNPAIANAYAGIAIASAQRTEIDPIRYLEIARSIKQVVLESDPIRFAPGALSTSTYPDDWIWTETTIQEWDALVGATK